jgi:hypothetical protein
MVVEVQVSVQRMRNQLKAAERKAKKEAAAVESGAQAGSGKAAGWPAKKGAKRKRAAIAADDDDDDFEVDIVGEPAGAAEPMDGNSDGENP